MTGEGGAGEKGRGGGDWEGALAGLWRQDGEVGTGRSPGDPEASGLGSCVRGSAV